MSFEPPPRDELTIMLPAGATRVRAAGATTACLPLMSEGGSVVGMTTFGASAPLKVLQKEFGFSVERVVEAAMLQLKREQRALA